MRNSTPRKKKFYLYECLSTQRSFFKMLEPPIHHTALRPYETHCAKRNNQKMQMSTLMQLYFRPAENEELQKSTKGCFIFYFSRHRLDSLTLINLWCTLTFLVSSFLKWPGKENLGISFLRENAGLSFLMFFLLGPTQIFMYLLKADGSF